MRMSYRVFNLINRFMLRKNIVLTPSLFQRFQGHSLELADHSYDFIRAATIRETLKEIDEREIEGAIAELGVYKGRTSALMNGWSPNRTLYLMDTFEGFDQRDLDVEKEEGYSSGKFEFSDTSAETVLKLMPKRENCKIVKGFFPESVSGISDRFAFVIIDVDLYQPIYEGLKWFWPQMVSGGVILVHDFGTVKFQGAKAAVREFSEETGAPYLPLCDTAGSVAFVKGHDG